MTEPSRFDGVACPVPRTDSKQILLGHGSGGRMSADLLKQVFLPAFGNSILEALEDQATVSVPSDAAGQSIDPPRIAITTDSFVVRPVFFPGGDIGKLAIHGTVNDLSVGGAIPRFIAASFILEEGLPIDDLKRVLESMRRASEESDVAIVTGDTKVVDRGKCDQLFITTTGIGFVPPSLSLSIHSAKPGDRVLLSGTIGDHGIAVMSVREGLEFETELQSDSASLASLTRAMLSDCPAIRCMRDPTRGGLASTLHELAGASGVGVRLSESAIPIRTEVRAACEILGLDPLHVANEGKLVAVVPAEDADRLLATMHAHPLGRDAAIIGEVVAEHAGVVTLTSLVGGQRIVPLLAGEQLPRIC